MSSLFFLLRYHSINTKRYVNQSPVDSHSLSEGCARVALNAGALSQVFGNELRKGFHGAAEVDSKLSFWGLFVCRNSLFDYKVNQSHPLTLRLNYPATTESPQSVFKIAFCATYVKTNHSCV